MRVIADHSRAAAFLIADGVQPSNEGRGYVLRRIMRRAIRHGSLLGLDEVFFFKVVDRVIELMGDAYPELRESRTFVLEVCTPRGGVLPPHAQPRPEDDRRGDRPAEGVAASKVLSGEAVFFLHDTHGFPWDLTQIIARERGFDVDQAGYEEIMNAPAADAGQSSAAPEQGGRRRLPASSPERLGATEFLGYEGEGHEGEGSVRAIVKDGQEVPQATAGDKVELVLDRTPFYGESGGQMGDTGRITGHGGKAVAQVQDAQTPGAGPHRPHGGGEAGHASRSATWSRRRVDGERRKSIRANHSATHLLHKALKMVLGDHVKQAGSVVAPDYLRFDYSHFAVPTPEQLEQVEDLVNAWIRENAEAQTRIMKLDEAKKSGAVAMFGEKYGETVRVVTVHPQSTELCGGTHVRRSGRHRPVQDRQRVRHRLGRAAHHRRHRPGRARSTCARLERELRKAAELLKTSPQGAGQARRGHPEAR